MQHVQLSIIMMSAILCSVGVCWVTCSHSNKEQPLWCDWHTKINVDSLIYIEEDANVDTTFVSHECEFYKVRFYKMLYIHNTSCVTAIIGNLCSVGRIV